MGCHRCGDLFDVPDGDYGAIDGAVRWLRNFTSPESRAAVAGALTEARAVLAAGGSPESAVQIIENRTGFALWDYIKGRNDETILAAIGILIAIVLFMAPEPPWKSDDTPTPEPVIVQIEQNIDIDDRDHIEIVLPGKPPKGRGQ